MEAPGNRHRSIADAVRGAQVPSSPRAHLWRLEDQTAEDE
jgi:hypothetical protein